jgi:hypothetical protein
MIDVLATALTYCALGAAAWALLLVVLNRPLDLGRPLSLALIGATLLLELGLLAQAVAGVVKMITDGRDIDELSFLGYLVGPVLVVPLAAAWALAERTRWGAGVLVVGFLAVPVMILRLRQVWDGNG